MTFIPPIEDRMALIISNQVQRESKDVIISLKYTDQLTGEVKVRQIHLPENAIVSVQTESVMSAFITGNIHRHTGPDPKVGKLVIYFNRDFDVRLYETCDDFILDDDIREYSKKPL